MYFNRILPCSIRFIILEDEMNELPDLTPEERIPLLLRSIFEHYGYRRYSMGRFEPYDVYWQNRSFLKSEQVLTFSNFDGKLMALRPDVTVSIAKNIAADTASAKLYYIENVFRQRQGSREYSEISQIGLENIGGDDVYSEGETLLLALKSLELLSDDHLLCLGHMGVIAAVMDWCRLQDERAEEMLELLRQKNADTLRTTAVSFGLSSAQADLWEALARISGRPGIVLAELESLPLPENMLPALTRLSELNELLSSAGYGEKLRLDFSVLCDLDYYNGLVFRGFIRQLPSAVLSGGRYDRLMARFDKPQPAIGFAVYWGEAERIFHSSAEYDADVLLLYESAQAAAAISAGDKLRQQGLTVRAEREIPAGFRARRTLRLNQNGETEETAHA